MSNAPVTLKKLAERVLSKGADLPLALMLEHLVPVVRLRDLARKHGLSPKGGFRIERVTARSQGRHGVAACTQHRNQAVGAGKVQRSDCDQRNSCTRPRANLSSKQPR